MDFEKVVNDIKEYIESTFPAELLNVEGRKSDVKLGKPSVYLLDYPDRDISHAVAVFIYPSEWEFRRITNMRHEMTNNISIFITFKGTAQIQVTKMLRYMEALYQLLTKDDTLGESVENSEIVSVTSYKAIEASEDVKALEVVLRVQAAVY